MSHVLVNDNKIKKNMLQLETYLATAQVIFFNTGFSIKHQHNIIFR